MRFQNSYRFQTGLPLNKPTSHPGQLSLAIPNWVDAMSTSQKAVMFCSWGVKAGMACVWWQAKLCDPCKMCHT